MDSLSNFSKRKYLKKQPNISIDTKYYASEIQAQKELYASSDNNSIETFETQTTYLEEEYTKVAIMPNDTSEYNDTIIAKTGEVWVCKVTSTKNNKIEYHFDPKGGKKVRRIIPMSKVKSCSKNSNQVNDVNYTNPDESTSDNNMKRSMHNSVMWSLLSIFPGILLFGIPTLFSLPLAIHGLIKTNKEPEKYSGKGLAIGIIVVLSLVIVAFSAFALAMHCFAC